MKKVLLYFGSFNPIHKGHVAVAEYAVEEGVCDEVVLIVSPQNPLKPAAELLPEMERFEMTEKACEASRYPDRIKPSVIEFLLPKPSYTIDTLRYLEEHHADGVAFAILMGADLVPQLPQWKEWEAIVEKYPIYVYPRGEGRGESVSKKMTVLNDAPQVPISSTEIRDLVRSGKEHYARQEWGGALNDFRRVLEMCPWYTQATEYVDMIEAILEFRHKDIYNP